MRNYSTFGISANGATGGSCWNLTTDTTALVPARVYDLTIGLGSAPNATDFELQCIIVRTTSAGVGGSTKTPLPLDPAGSPAGTVNVSTGHAGFAPTFTQTLLTLSFNQLDVCRWWCTPRRELRGLATSANGIGLQHTSTPTNQIYSTVMFQE